MTNPTIFNWKIYVHGYGIFDFQGTEDQAEEMRAHKAQWERDLGLKWRIPHLTEQDWKMQRLYERYNEK